MVEEHFTLAAGLRTEAGELVERSRASPGDVSQPVTPFPPVDQVPPPPHWSTSRIPDDDDDLGDASMSFVYERASGSAQAVDAIVLALDNQHLDDATEPPLPAAQTSDAGHLLATPFLPAIDDSLPVDPSYQYCSFSDSRNQPATPTGPFLALSAPLPDVVRDAPRHRASGPNNSIHLLQQRSTEFSSTSQKSLVAKMVCSGAQCNVQASPLPSLGACGLDKVPSGAALEVDEIMTEDAELETPNIDTFLDARRAARPCGINKDGLLTYQSSTETALRCQHLVRNRPRMRKHIKLRKRFNPPAMSSLAESDATPATMAS